MLGPTGKGVKGNWQLELDSVCRGTVSKHVTLDTGWPATTVSSASSAGRFALAHRRAGRAPTWVEESQHSTLAYNDVIN